MGNTCGIVTGSILVLGLEKGTDIPDATSKDNTFKAVQIFSEKFVQQHGSLLCRELLECDISTEEGYKHARSERLFETRCPNFVNHAIEILEEILGQAPKEAAQE